LARAGVIVGGEGSEAGRSPGCSLFRLEDWIGENDVVIVVFFFLVGEGLLLLGLVVGIGCLWQEEEEGSGEEDNVEGFHDLFLVESTIGSGMNLHEPTSCCRKIIMGQRVQFQYG